MASSFLDIARTPSVKAAQTANGVGKYWDGFKGKRDFTRFTETEIQFLAARDSFYMATVSESGRSYVQHRGGPPGFLRVLDDKTLAFADFRGNRQYITLGNAMANDRTSLIMVDYPNQRRLKIFAHIELKSLDADKVLATLVALTDYKAKPERAYLLHLEAFDWNCPQHIMPRYTEADIETAFTKIGMQLGRLEAENKVLREELARLKAI